MSLYYVEARERERGGEKGERDFASLWLKTTHWQNVNIYAGLNARHSWMLSIPKKFKSVACWLDGCRMANINLRQSSANTDFWLEWEFPFVG